MGLDRFVLARSNARQAAADSVRTNLYTDRTREDPNARHRFKRRLLKSLYRHGWTP